MRRRLRGETGADLEIVGVVQQFESLARDIDRGCASKNADEGDPRVSAQALADRG
jgi:hypothetical protein